MDNINTQYITKFRKDVLHLLHDALKERKTNDISKLLDFVENKCIENKPEDLKKILDDSLAIGTSCYTDIGLGLNSFASAVLFMLFKYNLVQEDEVHKLFNKETSSLFQGLVNIADFGTNTSKTQAESFRSFLLNLASDIRVVMIKLAERLIEMRGLKEANQEEQIKLSHEALYLYAPLGHKLGLYRIKSEMEDIALKFTEFETYKEIANKLNQTAKARQKFIADFIYPIKKRLIEEGLKFEIFGRPKSISSIYQKMKKTNVSFEEVYDKFAIRIILDSPTEKEKADCWKVYSVVTESYQPNPLRLRDWISMPKSNGYESLHTTVVVQGGQWVEIQIRTVRMNEIAEKGLAAHWKYKGHKVQDGVDSWMTKVRDIMENMEKESADAIDDFKLSLYHKEVFVFTPKGDLKKYPKGATILDFAFDIHTEVGSSCIGALVNGRNVSIRHQLTNGEKIEIQTSKNQKPKLDWLNYVVTSKAKSKIKLAINTAKVRDAEIGKDLIKRRFKNWKISYEDTNINKLMKHYKCNTSQEFYYRVANDIIDLSDIKGILTTDDSEKPREPEALKETAQDEVIHYKAEEDDFLLIDEKLANVDYKLSKCCNPVFGDDIFGFVTIGDGIKIHRVNCPNAAQMTSKYGYRIVKAKWRNTEATKSFNAELIISGIDEFGIFNKISDLITNDMKMPLRSINIDTKDDEFFGKISVMVRDKNHLEGLIVRLNQMHGINKVVRSENI